MHSSFQAGIHEVLGARYSSSQHGGGQDEQTWEGQTQTRKIIPALVNSRHENALKAQTYGRWILLNHTHPTESLGTRVKHGVSGASHVCVSVK